jgi:hypothetical protein
MTTDHAQRESNDVSIPLIPHGRADRHVKLPEYSHMLLKKEAAFEDIP